MTTARATSTHRALKRLGTARVTAFLRAVRRDAGVHAVELINEELDRGRELEAALVEGGEDGYHLAVTRLAPDRFRVEFGCVPGPGLGDGGAWEVRFDRAGNVVSCWTGIAWTS